MSAKGSRVSAPDRADELRAMPDLWPEVRRHVTSTFPDAELEAKFRKGETEHGRDWLNMTHADLLAELRAEYLDIALYLGMIRTRWTMPDAPPFTTNTDPGDEQVNH